MGDAGSVLVWFNVIVSILLHFLTATDDFVY